MTTKKIKKGWNVVLPFTTEKSAKEGMKRSGFVGWVEKAK